MNRNDHWLLLIVLAVCACHESEIRITRRYACNASSSVEKTGCRVESEILRLTSGDGAVSSRLMEARFVVDEHGVVEMMPMRPYRLVDGSRDLCNSRKLRLGRGKEAMIITCESDTGGSWVVVVK